jgi:hypothetical protein
MKRTSSGIAISLSLQLKRHVIHLFCAAVPVVDGARNDDSSKNVIVSEDEKNSACAPSAGDSCHSFAPARCMSVVLRELQCGHDQTSELTGAVA